MWNDQQSKRETSKDKSADGSDDSDSGNQSAEHSHSGDQSAERNKAGSGGNGESKSETSTVKIWSLWAATGSNSLYTVVFIFDWESYEMKLAISH